MLIKGVRKLANENSEAKDLIGFKIGKDRIVFTLSTKSLFEMYMNRDIDGRPYGAFYETRTFNLRRGILLTDGGNKCEIIDCSQLNSYLNFRFLQRSKSLCSASIKGIWFCS